MAALKYIFTAADLVEDLDGIVACYTDGRCLICFRHPKSTEHSGGKEHEGDCGFV